ncbi:TIGR03089 family protein [Frankia sp. Cpl3]|nr:TIGR03089 family protein [Frankia sp. Cpl3]
MDVRFVPASSRLRPAAPAGTAPAGTAPADAAPAAPFPGVAAALAARLTRDPGRPMITFYDDATGERVEFSTTTLDNWVAKTANLLVDTLGLAAGDVVGVDLPAHWTSCVILLAAWSAGLDVEVVIGPEDGADDPAGARTGPGAAPGSPGVVFVSEDRIDIATALGIDEIVGLSLRPLGGRMRDAVPGVLDYAVEVPPHGDRFLPPPPPPGQAELLRLAAIVARRDALGPDDRILTAGGPATVAGLLIATLVPLVSGASVVLCRNLHGTDAATLARRVDTERVTAVDWSVPRPLAEVLPARVRRLDVLDAGAPPG